MKARCVILLMGALGAAATALAGPQVLLCDSDGDLEVADKPGQYASTNILDDNPHTVWCSQGSGQGAEIEVVFSEKVSIDRMEVATGNQSSPAAFEAFSRVRELEVNEGNMTSTVQLEDKTGLQSLRFDPLLSTGRVVFLLKLGTRGKTERHTCLSDIIFYHGRQALNGRATRLTVHAGTPAALFVGIWTAGAETAPDRELVLGLTGSFRFMMVPTDPQEQPQRFMDEWRLQAERLELRDQDKWHAVTVKKDDAGRPVKLKIEGSRLQGIYRRQLKP